MTRSVLWRCLSPLMLIVAVRAYGAAAARPMPPSASQLLPFNTALGTGWTLADLDGDHQPDLAQSRSVAHDGHHLHRIDLHLSAGTKTGWFTFSNPDSLDLEVNAVDVDGDDDLDLIVTGRFSGQRIGVWINDGKGSFSRSMS